MEDPQTEIPGVISLLTQSAPAIQQATVDRYFTRNASFTHPFCRTGSFDGSRWLIGMIYRWYKILSPRIELRVTSVAFDRQNLILYATIHQIFRIWIIPFWKAPVTLTTVLQLVEDPPAGSGSGREKQQQRTKYLIQSQNDLYQVTEFVNFVSLFGVLRLLVVLWQFVATGLCVLGAYLFWPVSWVEQNVIGGNAQRSLKEAAEG